MQYCIIGGYIASCYSLLAILYFCLKMLTCILLPYYLELWLVLYKRLVLFSGRDSVHCKKLNEQYNTSHVISCHQCLLLASQIINSMWTFYWYMMPVSFSGQGEKLMERNKCLKHYLRQNGSYSYVARALFIPAAYWCPAYKHRLKCGLVTLLYLTSSTGMLIKILAHVQTHWKCCHSLWWVLWFVLWTRYDRKSKDTLGQDLFYYLILMSLANCFKPAKITLC